MTQTTLQAIQNQIDAEAAQTAAAEHAPPPQAALAGAEHPLAARPSVEIPSWAKNLVKPLLCSALNGRWFQYVRQWLRGGTATNPVGTDTSIKDIPFFNAGHLATEENILLLATPCLLRGDAIGNDVYFQAQSELGKCKPGLFCGMSEVDFLPVLLSRRQLLRLARRPGAVLVYHHAFHWQGMERLLRRIRCPLIVKYHNITPPQFFAPYRRQAAHQAALGMGQTRWLVQQGRVALFLADSPYNGQQLRDLGASPGQVRVLAPFPEITREAPQVDAALERELAGNHCLNLLFVGRVAPNKGHRHLIATMAAYVRRYGRAVRLHVVGGIDPRLWRYNQELLDLLREQGLLDIVRFHGKVSLAALHTYYSRCSMFLLLSEHEGFCVPILEAQHYGLPVLALDRGAVAHTLGPEQLLFREADYGRAAAAIRVVATQQEVRQYLVTRGRENAARFSHTALAKQFSGILDGVKQEIQSGREGHSPR